MKRRDFVSLVTKSSLGAAAVTLTGQQAAALPPPANAPVTWEMATSWSGSPFDTLFGGARTVCDTAATLTGGRFTINPHPAGGLPLENGVMRAVRDGTVPIAHTAAYFYMDMGPFVAFGTGVPFGLTARQQNAWLYAGGGLQLLQQLYAERFGLLQFPAGNTGAQMGGWFKNEVQTLDHLQGLKMRIAGLGAAVMNRLGVDARTNIPGSAILQAMQDGTVDAAEFVGPYDDEILGLHTVAPYYYYPGWWEPGATLEIQINLGAWNALPLAYQNALRIAAYRANMEMLATYDARNHAALRRLQDGGTQLRAFSDEIMSAAYAQTLGLLNEYAGAGTDFAAVLAHWSDFKDGVQSWHSTNELAYMNYISTL